MQKHTQGPWGACCAGLGKDNERRVTVVKTDLVPWGNAIADSRLIAAAPDLLDALTDLVGGCGKEGDLFSSAAMDKARAAINKANASLDRPATSAGTVGGMVRCHEHRADCDRYTPTCPHRGDHVERIDCRDTGCGLRGRNVFCAPNAEGQARVARRLWMRTATGRLRHEKAEPQDIVSP
jgi:hypothetical protein